MNYYYGQLPNDGLHLIRTYSIFDNQWRQPHLYYPDTAEWRVTQRALRPGYSREFARCYKSHRRYWVFFFHPRCLNRPVEYEHGDYPGRPDPELTLLDYTYDDSPPF